jgi:membrane protein YdbS with pleckstrin-like domain
LQSQRRKLEQYVKDRLLLLKMQAVEKISQVAAKLFSALIIAMLGFLVLLFVSLMAGYFFADITGSFYIGFGIVAAFYLLLLLLILKLRKRIIEKKVADEIVETIFDKTDDE